VASCFSFLVFGHVTCFVYIYMPFRLLVLSSLASCGELNLLAPWWSPLPVACTGVADNQEGKRQFY
jgi:hypothetical protein